MRHDLVKASDKHRDQKSLLQQIGDDSQNISAIHSNECTEKGGESPW